MPLVFEHRLDHIIRTARSRSGNKDFSLTSGVPQRDFVQFANDAQERIYNKMLNVHSTLFEKQAFADTTFGVAAVPLPASDIYLQHNVVTVHFAYNGNPINYAPLELRSARQEVSVNGYPSSYYLLDDNIILSPIPSNTVAKALRITYQKIIPTLDIRRAVVQATSFMGGTINVTLTNNSTLIAETEDDLTNGWVDYVSFVDVNGTILSSGKSVTSYNATTKVLVLTATLGAGESLPLGCYLVFGKNATTNAQLPSVCERYITEYSVLRAQMRDSNKEAADTNPLLAAIEQEIMESVEELEEDVSAIPIIDHSMLNYSDEL